MIESFLIEAVLSSFYDYLKKRIVTSPADRAKFDFVLKGEGDSKIAIEVKSQNPSEKILKNIAEHLIKSNDINQFYLITPENPTESNLSRFNSIFQNYSGVSKWMGINEYLISQNLGLDFTDDIRKSLLNLQIATLTSKYRTYESKVIGSKVGYTDLVTQLKSNIKDVNEGKINKDDIRFNLRRQFPDSIIATLDTEYEKIIHSLHFGHKYNEAIIVLTDIKNFSSIVSASDPDELNELMSKYYSNARELVFKYGGILDKFIGDAVLAIFNFPIKKPDAFKRALKFSSELILMGQNILNEFQKNIDQAIETGTRVGLATGAIYPLNLGKEDIEITFIGDKINFAARLEKNCKVNGILLSNRYYFKLNEYDEEFLKKIIFHKIEIDPKDAKGQIGKTAAWQIEYDQMEIILNEE